MMAFDLYMNQPFKCHTYIHRMYMYMYVYVHRDTERTCEMRIGASLRDYQNT